MQRQQLLLVSIRSQLGSLNCGGTSASKAVSYTTPMEGYRELVKRPLQIKSFWYRPAILDKEQATFAGMLGPSFTELLEGTMSPDELNAGAAETLDVGAVNDPDPLFGGISPGQQTDGTTIVDLGWAGSWLLETLGVEGLAGVSGFESADGFYRWMQNASGSSLPDWYGVSLRLYESWYLAPFEETFCYATWRTQPDENALKTRPVNLFCLRHVAWQANAGRPRAFNCARTRSYCEASHIKRYPGSPIIPAIMSDVSSDGLMVTGVLPGQANASVLDWPTPDMRRALALVSESKAAGVKNIHLWECGLGVNVDGLSAVERERLLKVDQYYDGEMMLLDVLGEAGLMTHIGA